MKCFVTCVYLEHILHLNSSKVMQRMQLRKALTVIISSLHIFHYMQQSQMKSFVTCMYLEHILHIEIEYT